MEINLTCGTEDAIGGAIVLISMYSGGFQRSAKVSGATLGL